MGLADSSVLLLCAIGALAMIPGALLLYGRPHTAGYTTALVAVLIGAGVWVLVGDAFISGRPSGVVALISGAGGRGEGADPVPVLLHLALASTALTMLSTGARWPGWPGVAAAVAWLGLVFLPVARWMLAAEWGEDGLEEGGFLVAGLDRLLGVPALDFAGGIVLHVTVGASVLAATVVARRRGSSPTLSVPPSGARRAGGAVLFWVGSLALCVGMEGAIDDMTPTILASGLLVPVVGALGWLLVEQVRDGKPTLGGAIAGFLAGVAVAVAGAAYLEVEWACGAGLLAGSIAGMASGPMRRAGFGSSHDLVTIHLVGGGFGALYLGVAAIGNGIVYSGLVGQFVSQLLAVVAVGGTASGITVLLATLVRRDGGGKNAARPQPRSLASPHE